MRVRGRGRGETETEEGEGGRAGELGETPSQALWSHWLPSASPAAAGGTVPGTEDVARPSEGPRPDRGRHCLAFSG